MFYKILLFLCLSLSIFSQEYQSKEQRIDAINQEINMLMEKKERLENLKENYKAI